MPTLLEVTPELQTHHIEQHLEDRFKTPDFVMAEIGHDAVPVIHTQPSDFTGQHAYIGIEAWLRDPIGIKHKELAELRSTLRHDQNIFFISHDIGGQVLRDYEEGRSWLEGEYDTGTVLPDAVADEILISNVLSDPHVAGYTDRMDALLQEASRLLRSGGSLVLRHTITPSAAIFINPTYFSEAGLSQTGILTPEKTEPWEMMEDVYRGDPSAFKLAPHEKSHYLLLRKA